ncbi:MAG TPA: hypothetical protein VE129_06920 [Thermoanaerobaculia bacterium]|nr:hypothetical protein [Thermoanaerobaculia bacterium]
MTARSLLAAILTFVPGGGAFAGPVPEPISAEALAGFARKALAEEPAAGVEDAYKWLFQAARGGEHAAPSEEAARTWLEKEWAALGPPLPGEPLVAPLRPDGAVVRLNLRPFKAAGGDPNALLGAFLSSARSFVPDPGLFVAAWRAYGRGPSGGGANGWDAGAFEELDSSSEKAGWPARHHSRGYAEARQPAYRVLTGKEADRLVRAKGGAR